MPLHNNKAWDICFMRMALVISEMSHATKLKVGCIAVRDRNIIGTGINGTPAGWVTNVCEDPDTGKTHKHVLHAETNLISKIANSTLCSQGSTVYCTDAPCMDCAKALHQAGIRRLVYLRDYKTDEGIKFLRDVYVEVDRLYPHEV